MLRLLAAISLSGCSLQPAAVMTTSAAGGDCEAGQTDGDLNLYNWAEYIDPELKTQFEEEFGVTVNEDNYDSNEQMQPIISQGNSGYDLIVPSDYMVSILIEGGDIVRSTAAPCRTSRTWPTSSPRASCSTPTPPTRCPTSGAPPARR